METQAYATIEDFFKTFPPNCQALTSLDQLTFKESLDVANEDFKGSVNGHLNISVCPSTVTHYQERRNCLLLKYSCALQIEGVEYGKTLRALILPDNLQTIRQITMRYAKGDKFNRFNGEVMNFYNDRYAVENFESDSILNLFTKAKWSKLKQIDNGVATLTEGSLIIFTRLLCQKWDHKSPVDLKFIDANAKIWDLKCERNHPKTSRVQIKYTKTLQYEREVDSFTYRTTRWRLENLIRWKKTGSEIAGMHQINQILEAQRLKPRKAQRYNPVTKTNVLARITTCKYRILQSPNGERTRFHDSDSDTDNFAKEQTKIPEPPRMNEWDKVFPPRLFDNLSFIAYETNCKSPDRQTKIPTSKRKSKTPCQLQMSTFFADFCKEEDKNTKTDWNKTIADSDLELSEIHEDLNLNLLFDEDCGTVDNPKVTEFTNVKEDLMPNVEENLKCATELCAGVIELIVEGHITQTSKTAKTASQQSTDFDTRMSEAQQIVKRRTLDYIQRHPELKSQLSSYLSKVIKEQPEDLHSFAADFFSRIK